MKCDNVLSRNQLRYQQKQFRHITSSTTATWHFGCCYYRLLKNWHLQRHGDHKVLFVSLHPALGKICFQKVLSLSVYHSRLQMLRYDGFKNIKTWTYMMVMWPHKMLSKSVQCSGLTTDNRMTDDRQMSFKNNFLCTQQNG